MKPWWTTERILRLLTDLIASKIGRFRPTLERLQRSHDPIGAAIHIGTQSHANVDAAVFDLDSLELVDLAQTIEDRFHLEEAGLDGALLEQRNLDDWVRIVLDGRARWDEEMSFETSGSTGRPKLCTHRMSALEQEVGCMADRFADRSRVLCGVPCHHIYGFLFGLMLPARLDIPMRDVRDSLPSSVLKRARSGDLIVANPAFFDMATRRSLGIAPGVTLLTSTSTCPPNLWRRLLESRAERVVEIYGSTENGGIGTRESSHNPFALLPYWSRLAGYEDRLIRAMPDARPQPTALQDRLRWIDDTRFEVLERRDGPAHRS
ncbi:AMP-binding protein [Imhoffiella purpurea]|uniref:4-coumarate--CoA ligase (4CL) (4-coumaroyl-CoA synthase) n=1 Tax=Imhoffiella purpurea TaxID=1249627 RepID=W9VFC5_9GAMM|nr:AMP-binding protein [Imhoffiella purpurea]EXJ15706.1 4-coumarate--CoA ligase (4CL) (4-coumaroyl-CoA synthase) [Imhoffiella purpurea]